MMKKLIHGLPFNEKSTNSYKVPECAECERMRKICQEKDMLLQIILEGDRKIVDIDEKFDHMMLQLTKMHEGLFKE